MDYSPSSIPREIGPNCVVGIGASAGGLEALQQFLTFLPSNTGMAFVIIQHLAPDHKSLLSDILGKYTVMPVREAVDGMRVERNCIYMIPPKYNLEIDQDVLRLSEYNHAKINHPIDIFFRSLAGAYENRAVAVILSGTGSDGTNGIRSIKDRNGLIIVQSPESAKFDGMPRNAIATGFVDLVLNPDAIARELSHIANSVVVTSTRQLLTDDDLMKQVFTILKDVTNINYAYYKQTTILRRIERRLVLTHNRNLREYVAYLGNNPDEARLLAKEVLIGVTSFFRDADYFDVLKERVIVNLIRNCKPSDQIRVWVAGCSTGEEAYSIAILFAEAMEELNIRREIKIFATDLDSDAIIQANRGIYGDNIIEDVSLPRLSRYFTRKGNKYAIRHDIRKMIIFAQHNVFQDPPFGKLDLISCRNLLIYFQTTLQRSLFAIFHMALNDRGYLFLGRSESVVDYDDIFRISCANEKIFVHNAGGKAPTHERLSYSMKLADSVIEPIDLPSRTDNSDISYKTGELDTSILEAMMPACLLVNEKNELIHSYGDCSLFINLPTGSVTLDIFSLIRNDLKIPLSTALRDAREKNDRIAYDEVPVKIGEEPELISVIAQPIRDRVGEYTGFIAVGFIRGKREFNRDMIHYDVDTAASLRIANLERELKQAKDDLRHTVTELESVNAELQAANEELLTANEELQSSNEELQSVNEELYTVNAEYQSKVSELAGLNNDMANFLSTTLIGIMMVDRNLNIRKYTEYIAKEFNVAEQDVGRSLRYISYNFATIDLMELCRKALDDREASEYHCASALGKTYLIRISPYRVSGGEKAKEDKTEPEGLVITFVDTTKKVDDQKQIDAMAEALRQAVRSGQEKEAFLSHMSHDMRTPMTAISGLTELTLQMEELPQEARDNLEKIRISSSYLTGLIEEVLETSRINAGKVVSVSTPVIEDSVIREVSTIIEERARKARQEFICETHGCRSLYALIDVEHVSRILLNLLSNAVKFTPPEGRITLTTYVSYTGSRVEHRYVVSDTGRGISQEFQQRMFQPFAQENLDGGSTSGTGLGLYICRSLVSLLGGTITCRSDLGEGTTFTVVMGYDIATTEQIRMHQRQSVSYEDRVLFGKNVLIAEDNSVNAEVIIRILASKGIHSELARDGQEAVEFFRAHGSYHYQAIIMDIMMPVMDGLAACEEIRKSDTADAETIPIIALSADATSETAQRCMNAGMNAHLLKPIDPERLFAALAEVFEQYEISSDKGKKDYGNE
ncbi:MAG: response regulator [Lachnospiraceae bacterium]|nr:response regulator [Lachnospiraceae bacterium]